MVDEQMTRYSGDQGVTRPGGSTTMARMTFVTLSDDDKTPFDGLQISSPSFPVPPTETPPTPSKAP